MFRENRVIIYTKKGCYFCDVLKASLTELNVEFDEEEAKGVAPVLLLEGDKVFTGLPSKPELVKFVVDNGLNGDGNTGNN